MSSAYIYILTNKPQGTLYIGSTTDLIKRIYEHKNKFIPSFTEKYGLNQLVYYEVHESILEAAKRERQLKNWRRIWKIELIRSENPCWEDLFEKII